MFAAQTAYLWGLNWYDWLVVVALLFGLWSGIRNGMTGEAVWLIGVVLMLVVGIVFYQPAGRWLHGVTGWAEEFCNLVGFVALALVIYIIALSIRQALHARGRRRSVFSATVENLGGAVGGVVRLGALMALVTVALCLTRNNFWHRHLGRESRYGSFVIQQIPSVAAFVQRKFPEKMWFLEDVKRREDPDLPASAMDAN